ncbi:MAG: phage tail protein [Pseudobacter sp.]|uniref:phage tail protein n=1 Tax=Pseudobacter sp. TaxID=2045420 RepID=UPI003F80EACB
MDPLMSVITPFAANFAPKGWALCNGQILPIATNQALFSLLGTTYGGNGTTNFALPNLQGRVAIGEGQGPGLANYTLGQAAGATQTTLLSNNLPNHIHPVGVVSASLECDGSAATEQFPDGFYIAGVNNAYRASPVTGIALQTPTYSVVVGSTGNNQPIPLMPPYTVLNFIIALSGIFPSRS